MLALAACAAPPPLPSPSEATLAPHALRPWHGGTPVSCVPFARAVSGIDLHGDAWTWWREAEGRYARGGTPRIGAVLVLKRTRFLPDGHVGVVAEVLGPREILVTQANWGSHGAIHLRQPVQDISAANDWSLVRFMNKLGTYGRAYPAQGFIYRAPPSALLTSQR